MSSPPHQRPTNSSNEVIQRFYSILERIVLFFAFDFTIDWKQSFSFFNRPRQNDDPGAAMKMLRKKCIHKPTVPPRSSPRKHIRANVKSFDEPKVEARKKSNVEMAVKKSSKSGKKNSKHADRSHAAADMQTLKEAEIAVPEMTLIKETENLSFEEENSEIQNPLSMLFQPIINLWSSDNNDDNDNFNNSVEIDQKTIVDDPHNASSITVDQKQDQLESSPSDQPGSEMDKLEEALNESPEKFIETLIAMNDASKILETSDPNNSNPKKDPVNESFGQQLLAEAGAQLIQQESISPQQNAEYSTHKQETVGNNFCINRTTTFHLEPATTFPFKL